MSTASDPLPLLTRPRRHLFLSPHYDDIPLSAGATVRLLANRGLRPETLVIGTIRFRHLPRPCTSNGG